MAGPVIGVIGGSGLYQIDGLADVEWRRVESPFGATSDEFCFGTLDGQPVVFVPAARPGPRFAALRDQFPRQYRRAEALRRHRHRVACRRSAACARISHPAISSSSTSSSTELSPGRKAFSARAASRMCRWRTRSAAASATRSRPAAPAAGIALKRGGTYLVMEGPQFSTPRRERALPLLELRRDRHDQHARGQARPRGRDLLRDGGDGHRLRLLAPGP